MPFTSFKTRVDCSAEKLWTLLVEKIRRPDKYVPGVTSVKVIKEFGPTSIEREMVAKDGQGEKTVREIITADEVTMSVMFKLKDDPVYTGYVLNTIFSEDGVVELDYTLHWTLKEGREEAVGPNMTDAIKNAVLHTKKLAESEE